MSGPIKNSLNTKRDLMPSWAQIKTKMLHLRITSKPKKIGLWSTQAEESNSCTLHGPSFCTNLVCTLQSMGYLQIFAPLPSTVRPMKTMNIPLSLLIQIQIHWKIIDTSLLRVNTVIFAELFPSTFANICHPKHPWRHGWSGPELGGLECWCVGWFSPIGSLWISGIGMSRSTWKL